jgi:hypothetical protein
MEKEKDNENSLIDALNCYIAKNRIPDRLESTTIGMHFCKAVPIELESYSLLKQSQVTEPDDAIVSYIENQKNKETFSVMLNRFREERKLEAPELYKAADIDRKLYSRIMGERDYKPSKNTVISFGLALKLSDSDMDALLESAGYALSRSVIFDLVISFCLENMIYSIPDVNALLLARNEPLLRTIK